MNGDGTTNSVNLDLYGSPAAPIATNSSTTLFQCAGRLCAIRHSDQEIALAANSFSGNQTGWLVVKGLNYAVAGINGKLTLLRGF